MKKVIFLVLLSLGLQQVYAQKTLKVWIVRHAEKDLSDSTDRDPELSPKGAVRAEALRKELRGQKLDSIFSTNYKRTKLTAFPLADITGINIKSYNAAEARTFAEGLKTNAIGKKILIVGHSNTVLELIEAFGGKRPIDSLTEDMYDNLFYLTVTGGKVDVRAKKYGDK
jgi:2,3-bisphosphoglycerate-dependent phosphoglycerate mutase